MSEQQIHMESLINTIEDIKQKITDSEYKTLMDNLKTVHDTKEKNQFYEVTYFELKPVLTKERIEFGYKIEPRLKRDICKMSDEITSSDSFKNNDFDEWIKDRTGDCQIHLKVEKEDKNPFYEIRFGGAISSISAHDLACTRFCRCEEYEDDNEECPHTTAIDLQENIVLNIKKITL